MTYHTHIHPPTPLALFLQGMGVVPWQRVSIPQVLLTLIHFFILTYLYITLIYIVLDNIYFVFPNREQKMCVLTHMRKDFVLYQAITLNTTGAVKLSTVTFLINHFFSEFCNAF